MSQKDTGTEQVGGEPSNEFDLAALDNVEQEIEQDGIDLDTGENGDDLGLDPENEQDPDDPTGENPDPDAGKHKKSGIDAKFRKLTARTKAAEERATRAEEERQKLLDHVLKTGGTPDVAGNTVVVEPEEQLPPKPTEDDPQYETHADFVEALSNWNFKKNEKELRKSIRDEIIGDLNTGKQKEQEKLQAKNAVDKMYGDGRKRWKDFDDVLDTMTEVTPTVDEAVTYSECSHVLAYYLGKHPEELEILNGKAPAENGRILTKTETIKRIGRLEAGIIRALSASASDNPGKNKNTPAEIQIPFGGARPATLPNPGKESYMSFRARRLKEMHSR